MKKRGVVHMNEEIVGSLEKNDSGYVFKYTDEYFSNANNPSISVTLPKTKQEHFSEIFFPFFFNMLSEGANKQLQCRHLKIDENDYFSLLLATSNADTIGAVYVTQSKE